MSARSIIAMEEVYSAADFAITRSGAASLAELAAFSLPAILIPYPYAAEDHQSRNAEIFVRAGAALLLKESDLTAELLAQKIRELLERSPGKCSGWRKVSARLAPKNAADARGRNDGKIYPTEP